VLGIPVLIYVGSVEGKADGDKEPSVTYEGSKF
jgi:hypothetical protein